MIPFLASTMFQNQFTSNWRSNDETKSDKKDYLKILKFKPMLVKVNASHILADFKPQLINLSMVKEVRPGWSNLQDGTPKENWSQIDFIDGNSIYVQSNIDSFLQNDKLDTALKNVLGDANRLVDEIRSHYVSNEEADENAVSLNKREPGLITQQLLDFVDSKGAATYSEMNEYYKRITGGSNSFSHHLANLRIPYKNRKTQRYLAKEGKPYSDAKYVVKLANPSNWVVVDNYDDFKTFNESPYGND